MTGRALVSMEQAVRADPYNAGAWKLLAVTQLRLLQEPEVSRAFPGLRGVCVRTLREALGVFPHDRQMRAALDNLTAEGLA